MTTNQFLRQCFNCDKLRMHKYSTNTRNVLRSSHDQKIIEIVADNLFECLACGCQVKVTHIERRVT